MVCLLHWGNRVAKKACEFLVMSLIPGFIFNLYKLVMFRQIYTEYDDTGKQCFPVKG